MADWSEIKNLAEKLKKIQVSECTNYLSDRMCVDIVSYLVNSGRLRLIRTIDGRTLLTENELLKEIVEELEAHRGRITLVELSNNLEIEYSVIESHVNELLSNPRRYFDEQCVLVAGDLMTKSFVKGIAEEVRDRLEFRGVLTVTELTRLYNFTPQFMNSVLNEYNGILFNIHKEGDKIYTQMFLPKQKSKVFGYLCAVVTPISIADCANKLDLPPKFLTGVIDSLVSTGKLRGALAAGRSIYTPSCYRRAQDAYIEDFLKQNGYVDWNLVQRLGIPDPSSYLRSRFPNAIHTKEFTIWESTASQIMSVLADKSSDNQWIDVSNYLPQVFGAQEREFLIKPLLKDTKFVPIGDYMYLYPTSNLSEHLSCFADFLREQAAIAAREQKRKTNSKVTSNTGVPSDEHPTKVEKKGKSGGFGGRAREIKIKHNKRKYLKKTGDSDGEDVQTDLALESYLPREKLFSILKGSLGSDIPEEVLEGILDELLPRVHDTFSSLVKSVYLQTSDSSKMRDKCLAEKSSLISAILSIQLFERGSLAVDNANLRIQLIRQLIRSEVSTLVNRLYILLAQNYDLDWPSLITEKSVPSKSKQNEYNEKNEFKNICRKESTDLVPAEIIPQQRDSLAALLSKIGEGPMKHAAILVKNINSCLRGNADISFSGDGLPLDEVFSYCDNLASSHLGIDLSIPALRGATAKRKRQDRLLSLEIASQMEQQIANAVVAKESNYLASLTLAGAALLGQCIAGWPLPAHGKLVPQLADWVSKKLSEDPAPSASYGAAINELRSAKAGIQLIRLTELVMQEARHSDNDGGDSLVSEEEKAALVEEFLSTVGRCWHAMQGTSPNPSKEGQSFQVP